eukprot:31241-Pelagococcus_subviridis.AAC.7
MPSRLPERLPDPEERRVSQVWPKRIRHDARHRQPRQRHLPRPPRHAAVPLVLLRLHRRLVREEAAVDGRPSQRAALRQQRASEPERRLAVDDAHERVALARDDAVELALPREVHALEPRRQLPRRPKRVRAVVVDLRDLLRALVLEALELARRLSNRALALEPRELALRRLPQARVARALVRQRGRHRPSRGMGTILSERGVGVAGWRDVFSFRDAARSSGAGTTRARTTGRERARR